MLLLLLLIIFLLAILASLIVFLLYWVPSRLGYRKTGIVLASLAGCLCVALAIVALFEDQLFTKKEAIELLAEQDIRLTDSFDLLENKSMSAIGDYYHTFTLQISAQDKRRIITQIRRADNFQPNGVPMPDITLLVDRYTGTPITQNYESEGAFIRKLFKPVGPGYAPTHHVITVPTQASVLVFEDITE